jgi:hypothetical protein
MTHKVMRDANHDEIRAVCEIMLAGNVTDTSRAGDGLGDLYVSYGCYGAWIEIKRDAKATLTPDQERFHRMHKGCIFRVENVEQAENACRIVRARGMALAS